MEGLSSLAWYLIHTKPKQESLALVHLMRQNYTAYLPFVQVRKRVRGVQKQIQEPMFARYLFIRLSSQHDNWAPIRSTRGVNCLVRFGGMPAQVPESLIQVLQYREQRCAEEMEASAAFTVGKRVEIVEGVMQGYTGIITEVNSKKRVRLLLDLVNHTKPIEIAAHALQTAN